MPYREDKAIYRLRRGREWLDAAEGRELAALLAAYWECRGALPPRVREAMWRMAFGPRIRWADMLVPILVSGLEALLKIGRRDLTEQFRKRVPALAADLDVDGMTEDLAEQLYDGRSDWVHGSHVQLFVGPGSAAEAQGDDELEGPQTGDEQSAFTAVALLQDVSQDRRSGDRGPGFSPGLRGRRDHRGALAGLIDCGPHRPEKAQRRGYKWVLS